MLCIHILNILVDTHTHTRGEEVIIFVFGCLDEPDLYCCIYIYISQSRMHAMYDW